MCLPGLITVLAKDALVTYAKSLPFCKQKCILRVHFQPQQQVHSHPATEYNKIIIKNVYVKIEKITFSNPQLCLGL